MHRQRRSKSAARPAGGDARAAGDRRGGDRRRGEARRDTSAARGEKEPVGHVPVGSHLRESHPLPAGCGRARARHQTTVEVRREVLPVLRNRVCR